ncbi:MAG: outer membrane protein assembly factor BamA [Akkermansia sp.]|nr:outer membrane protein assembly factor BamA [Akkermansia sp.]
MNARNLHWAATLAAIAMSVSLSAKGQGTTGDPFLDAMISDQSAEAPAATPAPEPRPAPAAPQLPAEEPTDEQAAPAPKPIETRFVSQTEDTKLVSSDEVMRELGPSTGLFGNDGAYEGKQVKSVRIRYTSGKRTVPDERLLDIIQTTEGSKYSTMRINDDLERLINRGLVGNNARVAVDPSGNGVRVTFEVQPANVMGGVGFTGNTRFSERQLREGIKLQSSKVINDRELAAARAEIIKMYQEAGYPDTRVSWRHAKTQRSEYDDIIFDITEGREVSMNHIRFEGNRQFDAQQLRQMMKTKERGLFTWITKSGRIDREQVEDDLQEIVRHYRNYGYLRARITKVEYTDNGKKTGRQKLSMKVIIDEGPRYKVRNVSFGGISVYTPQELEPGLSMLGGDIYSLQKVSDDTTMIRKYYGAKGYADADVRPDINEVGAEQDGTRLVDIRYNVKEGGRYAVGRINVRGNTKTKPHVILRELPLKPGQYLNSVDLDTARKRLENLGYFEKPVEVSQTSSGTAGYRDINVNVREKMTGMFTVGAAFSSVESLYFYANVTQSNFDIRGLFGGGSLVGGGQRLTLSGRVGWEYQSASVYLLEPWFLDRKLALGNEIFFSNSSYMSDYYRQKNYGYAISLRKALNDYNSLKLEYRIEQFNLEAEGDAPIFFRTHCDDFTRSRINLTYQYDSRDAMITPRKGGHFEVTAGYSGPGSTVETYSAGIAGSVYYNSFWDSIFSINFGVETVDTVDSKEEVPLFERCYLGGPTNLRGFRFRDVGMVDEAIADDESMGGNTSAFVQLEVTVPVVETVRFAAFVDAGFVNADSFDFDTGAISADYGFGLRINLPMGPLAVDYAIPFKTGNAIDRSGQFQFYVDYKY